jgi:hypothetical protein
VQHGDPPPIAHRSHVDTAGRRRLLRQSKVEAEKGQITELSLPTRLDNSVSAIPILPGGGGTIEATMSAGLILAGGKGAAVIAAVLLYRIVSAWALVPLG